MSSNNNFKCLGNTCPNHCCGSFNGISNRLTSISDVCYSDIILLPNDVENIRRIGREDLIAKAANGLSKLKTYEDGTCHALKDGRCLIYEARPAICKAFPLYLDMFAGISYINDCPAFSEKINQEFYDRSKNSLLDIYQFWIDFYKNADKSLSGDGIIECCQLNNEDELTDEELERIAGLVYDTDVYIYPAMFETRENALKIIPQLIKQNDTMFRLENIYVARYNKKIVGIVLWKKGSLVWSKEQFVQISNKMGIPVSKYLDFVTERYIQSYADVEDEERVSMVNFCVSSEIRGCKIGSKMMQQFLMVHREEQLELCVLEENPSAVKLYQNYGFVENSRYKGFSIDDRDLVCIGMLKDRD